MKCYHIWTVADGGNAFFRAKRCFASRGHANTVIRRGGQTGERGRYIQAQKGDSMVLQCRADCPCRKRGCPSQQ